MEENSENFTRLLLNHNGIYFNASVEDDTAQAILKDDDLFKEYSKQVYEDFFDDQKTSASQMNPGDVVNAAGVKIESIQTVFKWTDELTKLLVKTRLNMEDKFTNPNRKKVKYWEEIAKKINSVSKINITADTCNTKYRNLLATYKTNKRKQSSNEWGISWEYFDDFDKVLGKKISIDNCTAPEKLFGYTFSKKRTNSSYSIETYATPSTSRMGSTSPPLIEEMEYVEVPPTKRKKLMVSRDSGISLQVYLKKKLDRQRQKDRERREENREKLAWEEKLWKEKKELKERKIAALVALANAIRKQC